MSNIFKNENEDDTTTSLSFTTSSDGLLSLEDRQNLDRLLTSSNNSPSNFSNSLEDSTSKSASRIQASSASLFNDSQMSFVFLKHKAYNYDSGFSQEENSDTKVSNQKLNAHGLFENSPDNDQSNIITENGQQNNLFKEDTRSKKPFGNKNPTEHSQQNKVSCNYLLLLILTHPHSFINLKMIYYQEFLDRLMLPKSQPICIAIR